MFIKPVYTSNPCGSWLASEGVGPVNITGD
jgi:hypothetical protein